MVVFKFAFRIKSTKLTLLWLVTIISLLSLIRFAITTELKYLSIPVESKQEIQQQAIGLLQSPRQYDDDQLHPVTKLLLENPDKQVLYVEFWRNHWGHGLGSLVMILLYFHSYFKREILILNEADILDYRFNETIGPFSGYFQSSFPVLESRGELELIKGQLLNHTNTNVTWDEELIRSGKIINRIPITKRIAHIAFTDRDYMQVLKHTTKEVCNNPQNDICHLPQAGPLFCNLFGFQPNIEESIQEHFQPNFPDLDFKNSVAFHVRRGDKVNDEDTFHAASEYVQFFLRRLQSKAANIKHCFLASDDPTVKTEMESALKEYNVTCKLHSISDDNTVAVASSRQSRKSISRTMDFMVELYAMIHSTYFVGRNKSNVWKLAVLFRGCRSTNNDGDGAILKNNFHSYELLNEDFSLFHVWGLK